MRQPVSHLRSAAEYCHQIDAELIDNLRRRASSEERHRLLAEASQTREPAVLDLLEKLGYDSTTVMLLFVVPLVQVAWADGSISLAERDHIFAIASLRGVKSNTPAYERLMVWLDQKPADEFLEGSLSAIGAVLSSLPAAERKICTDAILLCCRDAAAAPCRFFKWVSRVCAAKRRVIENISVRLEPKQQMTA